MKRIMQYVIQMCLTKQLSQCDIETQINAVLNTCFFRCAVRARIPYSSTGTLSSVHISGTISTLIGSITTHFSGAHVDCHGIRRIQCWTVNYKVQIK